MAFPVDMEDGEDLVGMVDKDVPADMEGNAEHLHGCPSVRMRRRPEWGAEPGKDYIVLAIQNVEM